MNKLLSVSLLAGSVILATTAVHAQAKVSIGPLVGETLMKQHASNDADLLYRFGWLAGAQAYVSWGRFTLQPALLFSQQGFKYSTQVLFRSNPSSPDTYVELNTRTRLNYLTLPLNFMYAPAGTATGPQFFAGPYVSMLVGGTVEQDELPGQPASTTSIRIANETSGYGDRPTTRRFDTGFQAGLGFRYDGLVVQASYSLGLANTRPTYTNSSGIINDLKAYNRGFQFHVGYLFDLTH